MPQPLPNVHLNARINKSIEEQCRTLAAQRDIPQHLQALACTIAFSSAWKLPQLAVSNYDWYLLYISVHDVCTNPNMDKSPHICTRLHNIEAYLDISKHSTVDIHTNVTWRALNLANNIQKAIRHPMSMGMSTSLEHYQWPKMRAWLNSTQRRYDIQKALRLAWLIRLTQDMDATGIETKFLQEYMPWALDYNKQGWSDQLLMEFYSYMDLLPNY